MSETISRGQVLAAFRAYLGQRVYINNISPKVIEAAVGMLEADGTGAPAWIRVGDRLPAEGADVLTVREDADGYRIITTQCRVGDRWSFDVPGDGWRTTHWKALRPELPEEV